MLRSSFLSPNHNLHQQSSPKSNRASFFTPIKATSSTDDAISKSPQLQKHRRPADENIREEARRDVSSHNFSARYAYYATHLTFLCYCVVPVLVFPYYLNERI